jgi:cytochrome b561
MANNRWVDSPNRYGYVTRILHWIMAALLAWQFLSMACKLVLGRTPLTAFMVGSHGQIGTVLMLLIVLRVIWAVCNRRTRPPHEQTWMGRGARAGHGLLYALMFIVPALALVRQYGSDRPLVVFGMRLMEPQPTKIEWLMAPANAVHGLLAWALLALIAGHVVMVMVHHYRWRDDTVSRMIGKAPEMLSRDSATHHRQ